MTLNTLLLYIAQYSSESEGRAEKARSPYDQAKARGENLACRNLLAIVRKGCLHALNHAPSNYRPLRGRSVAH